jgi:hypothetical protein
MSIFDIEAAKRAAEDSAKSSLDRNCLYRELSDETQHDENLGDAETLDTIVSSVLSVDVEGTDDGKAEIIIMDHLRAKFPSYY